MELEIIVSSEVTGPDTGPSASPLPYVGLNVHRGQGTRNGPMGGERKEALREKGVEGN